MSNRNQINNSLSNKMQSMGDCIKQLSEESIKDLFMTINLNCTILSQVIINSSNSNSSVIQNTNAIISEIINVISHNIRIYSLTKHIDNSTEGYKDYLNNQIEKERNKKKIFQKEITILIDKEEKIIEEINQIQKKSMATRKGENEINIVDLNTKTVEMNNELRNIEEINTKIKELNKKEKEEIALLEKEVEILHNKLTNLLEKDKDKTKDKGSRSNNKENQISFDYDKYFEIIEKQCLAKVISEQNINNDIDNKSKEDNQRTIENNHRTRTVSNDNIPIGINYKVRENSMKRKSLFNNVFALKKKASSNNMLIKINMKLESNNNKSKNSNQQLWSEYQKEKTINHQYQLIIAKYKELYHNCKMIINYE